MKKLLQIVGITLGSIVGLIVVAAAVAVWCVFTPERLTPVARSVADQYITCEWDMGNVDLTFFSTFPEFGLHIDGLYLINPMKGAPSDTVLKAPSIVAKLDVMAYLQHNNLIVREVELPDIEANIFINAQGATNLSVIKITPDTSQRDSAFYLPFDTLEVQACNIDVQRLTFVDEKDTIDACLGKTSLQLTVATFENVQVQLASEDVNVHVKGETYANHLKLQLDLPAQVDLEKMHFYLDKSLLSVNDLQLTIDGDVTIADSIALDAHVACQDWPIATIVGLLPASVTQSMKGIHADGLLSLDAHANGIYGDSIMPLIDARVQINNGEGHYDSIPYHLTGVAIDASAHVDLNRPALSKVAIHQLDAQTLQTQVSIRGTIDDILGEQVTKAHITMDAHLPDWAYYIPQPLVVAGDLRGKVDVEARIADVLAQRMDRIMANGKMELNDIHIQTDSLQANLPHGQLGISIQMDEWPVIKASIDLQSQEVLSYKADSIDATIQAPIVHMYAAFDTKDSTKIPTFDANIQFKQLDGQYTTHVAHLENTTIEAKMTGSRRSQSIPVFNGTLSSSNLSAQIGGSQISTQHIDMRAKALYRKDGEKFLLRWNPMLDFALNQAEADVKGFDQHISVPQIIFKYSNRDFDIMSSSVVLGHSDFSLTGNIHHIGKWLMNKAELTGELNFTSNHTDVNELLSLFSAKAGSEEKSESESERESKSESKGDDEPFLVPTNVDLTLNTHINEAIVFNQTAKNLGGKVYIKDGVLVLEEMGFVCDAAKLQLTAMYRTPLRDHIYVGLDYHMIDVKIDQLISMIPQIDSMVPMLKAFKGDAEFHLAAETFLKSNYQIKTSTLRGACSIFGKDLVVMDSETFNKISKILLFKKKTENIVDSISAEITLYKDEVDVYPFCVSMDNYMVALGGRHKLDMSYNYHINILSPIYLGVDINGTQGNLSIKPAKCIYAKDFKPIIHNNVNTQTAELRQLIRNSLRENVKIK